MSFAVDRETLEKEVEITFVRSSGPGGQHRNKTETGVRMVHPPSGITVQATERRSQMQNKELAFERLAEKLRLRNHVPKKRKATRPTHGSVKRRLDSKKQRGQMKKTRKPPQEDT
jgi:ribosome-associated protein|tara:strand:+ start:205 stop:549 length:345 start_codon:yes stop_codon:yes gene_type:complete